MTGFQKYKILLGEMESGNDYQAVNLLSGSLGKYQFIPITLNALQFNYSLPAWIGKDYFLNSPELQEIYINAQIQDGLIYLERSGLKNFIGTSVSGSKRFSGSRTSINIYGVLAGVHIGGAGNLKRFLLQGINADDGYTSISDYIYYFSENSSGGFPVVYGVGFALLLFYLF